MAARSLFNAPRRGRLHQPKNVESTFVLQTFGLSTINSGSFIFRYLVTSKAGKPATFTTVERGSNGSRELAWSAFPDTVTAESESGAERKAIRYDNVRTLWKETTALVDKT